MSEKFLYESMDALSKFGTLEKEMPKSLVQNINARYELRAYQVDAFARFLHCYQKDFPGKDYPLHFLFNMATGSGKTLIMAGLMLYLYEQGYRNFLFFVNATNIIEKTKDNFLNPDSIKYLFNRDIHIGNRRVHINAVQNFESADPARINICFTTIQKLHSDLTVEKENALTVEDFRKHKIVLLSDEAHHMNVQTKAQQEMFSSWENTVRRIFNENPDNLLLEFTATHDYQTPEMVEEYRNKVIIRYDLLQFRQDLYSKDVAIVHSDLELEDRILQALIISQWKQEVAAKHRINLKPVILFKANKFIKNSIENQAIFHRLVDDLSPQHVANLRRKSQVELLHRALHFFKKEGISPAQLVKRLKSEFRREFCLSVNDEKEKVHNQILVNTLEDVKNRIRAIFAVQKLNEGWDVLNLFDIVRCYETRDVKEGKPGKTTLAEAQLIGRGARYFPFVTEENDDRFRRKFDSDTEHELRIMEELHYHSINDSRYISEIRAALVKQGMLDAHEVVRKLQLKEQFKKTDLYKTGIIWLNDRRVRDYRNVRSLADLSVGQKNYVHTIASGQGNVGGLLSESKKGSVLKDERSKDIKVLNIERNIVQCAIARNPFYRLSSIKRYFPNLQSMRDFMCAEQYLGGLAITFEGGIQGLDDNRYEKLLAMLGLLEQIEDEIRQQVTDYEGTRDFKRSRVHEIFRDKLLKFDSKNPRAVDDPQFEHFVSDKKWFAFNTVHGSEEKSFVRMLARHIQSLQEKYKKIYLLRNEGFFAIYNFSDGRKFQPDFVLFLQQQDGQMLIYQFFVEPKGTYLHEHDRWKNDLLKDITKHFAGKPLVFGSKKYRLIGLPFYNCENENEFRDALDSVLD